MSSHKKIIIFLFFSFLMVFRAEAKELPLWELGLGPGALHQSYYTGTKQTRAYAFPVVLPVYRGDFFKSDDKGMRLQLFKDDRYKLDLSSDFNFAVDSDDIDLREGMPDIGSLLEVGPFFEFKFWEAERQRWFIRLPFRAVTEIDDGNFDSAGYIFSPTLALEKKFSGTSWRLGASVTAKFGDKKYNSIYYTVGPAFATAERSAYEAGSGYTGSRLQLALSSKSPNNLLVLFMRYDNIKDAVFDDSPLVETNDNVTVGFIYSRYFFKSTQTVTKDDLWTLQ